MGPVKVRPAVSASVLSASVHVFDYRKMVMTAQRLIAIGASEGGVRALIDLVRGLPANLPAAILVVLHIDGHPSSLPALLARHTSMHVDHAKSGASILANHIYVAPPDLHLLVEGTVLRLWRGPKEHFARPAIDPLFRSAADSWGSKLLGVILTGNLNDGTLGLRHIKQAGGKTIAQDPGEARAPGMPASAIQASVIDVVATLHHIPVLIEQWATPQKDRTDVPTSLRSMPMAGSPDPTYIDPEASNRSPFVCPTCKGSLARSRGSEPSEFTCYTGHRFTLDTFAKAQSDATDDALWLAYRALKEKEMLLDLLSSRAHAGSDAAAAASFNSQRERVSGHARTLLELTEDVPGSFSELSQ